MKNASTLHHSGRVAGPLNLLIISGLLVIASCSDSDSPAPAADPSPATATYRADVALSWLNMELRLARTTPPVAAITFGRPFAYAGVAGYEAAVPGMAGYRSLAGQLNGLSGNQAASSPTSRARRPCCPPRGAPGD